MSWGFERGRVYNRRQDIHGRFGGQQQGGIITPANHNVVIIITGDEGLEHGYADRQRPDGVFEYFGEGQVGDMQWVRGNRAIAAHSADSRSLLLFRKVREGLRFEDEMVYEGHQIRRSPDREGNMRDAIVFELRPLNAISEAVDADPVDITPDLNVLRARAYAAADSKPKDGKQIASTAYERARDVKVYVLARASGACEGCDQAAPFKRKDGTPYLEPHHLYRVSDGGPDHPAHVIALCPTCHRRVHHGVDAQEYNARLVAAMAAIER